MSSKPNCLEVEVVFLLFWWWLTYPDLFLPMLTHADLSCPSLSWPDLSWAVLTWPVLTCANLYWPGLSCPDLSYPVWPVLTQANLCWPVVTHTHLSWPVLSWPPSPDNADCFDFGKNWDLMTPPPPRTKIGKIFKSRLFWDLRTSFYPFKNNTKILSNCYIGTISIIYQPYM